MAHFRQVHINGEVWRYHIGGMGVEVRSPTNVKTFTRLPEFFTTIGQPGWDWDTLERAEWKGYWPEIGPGDVKRFIEHMQAKELEKKLHASLDRPIGYGQDALDRAAELLDKPRGK